MLAFKCGSMLIPLAREFWPLDPVADLTYLGSEVCDERLGTASDIRPLNTLYKLATEFDVPATSY
jgi:hypothetical protein